MASTDLVPFSRVLSLQAVDACSSAVGSGFAGVGGAVVKVWGERPARLSSRRPTPSAKMAQIGSIHFDATALLLPEGRHEAVATTLGIVLIAFEFDLEHALFHRGADAEHQHEERHGQQAPP